MTRLSAALLSVVMMTAAAPIASAAPGDDACRHYENRARFKSRVERVEHVTVLAEACLAARAALERDEAAPVEREAARRYLAVLEQGRSVIREINDSRLSRRRDQVDERRRVSDLRESLRLVSSFGEYLILRDAGVFDALDDWVRSGGDFALAAAMR